MTEIGRFQKETTPATLNGTPEHGWANKSDAGDADLHRKASGNKHKKKSKVRIDSVPESGIPAAF